MYISIFGTAVSIDMYVSDNSCTIRFCFVNNHFTSSTISIITYINQNLLF